MNVMVKARWRIGLASGCRLLGSACPLCMGCLPGRPGMYCWQNLPAKVNVYLLCWTSWGDYSKFSVTNKISTMFAFLVFSSTSICILSIWSSIVFISCNIWCCVRKTFHHTRTSPTAVSGFLRKKKCFCCVYSTAKTFYGFTQRYIKHSGWLLTLTWLTT